MTKEDIKIQACLYEDSCHNPNIQTHFIEGAEWMQKKMYWKARKAFCSAVCPDGCPQLEDDIEGGGSLVVNCKKYHAFIKTLEEDV